MRSSASSSRGFSCATIFSANACVDALVDLPFALPTAVAGITLATLYAPNGWIGDTGSAPLGIKIAYTRLGVFVALTFIGLPFIVRTVQPVLEDLDAELEEAAASLGANRWQTFWRVIFPMLTPALLTGFALAFARALGEYGSVVFISSNIPMKTQITPLLIMTKLEEFDYAGATALAVVMLVISFVLLLDHQCAAMVGQSPQHHTTCHDTSPPQLYWFRTAPRTAVSTTESPFVRALLIGIALVFLALFLVIPLVSVFAQAFAKGLGFYFQTLPTRWPGARSN